MIDEATELLYGDLSNKNLNYNNRALPVGVVLDGKYEILDILGEGGFGITYLCFDKKLKTKVAIKEYFPGQFSIRDSAKNSEITALSGDYAEKYYRGLRDFEAEAKKLTRFSDLPGIVSAYNFFLENNTAYLVMEYIDGITLKEYLQKRSGKIEWKEALNMMEPVIDSFSKIHKGGIIHRDISPVNIMISRDGKITIIDFGASREDDSEKSKTVVLKHGYAPPEQYSKKGKQGAWTDVYSLCATLFVMITGQKMPDSMTMTISKQSVSLRKYVPSVPVNIERAILKGLELDINSRIQSMDELSAYLYGNKKIKRKISSKFVIYVLGILVLLPTVVALIITITKGKQNKFENANIGPNEDIVSNESLFYEEIDEGIVLEGIEEYRETFTYEDDKNVPGFYLSLPQLKQDNFKYHEVDGGICIDSVNEDKFSFVIPNVLNGKRVMSVSRTNGQVVSIYIQNGIEQVNDEAFRGCAYLEKVYIPSSVKNIGKGVFDRCLSLNEVIISDENETYYVVENKILQKEDGQVVASW